MRDDMSLKEKTEYIIMYYKWHILLGCAAIGLIIFLIVHFAFHEKKMEFSCALINQRIDYDRDETLEKDFANAAGLDAKRIDIDSDYNISYPGHELEDANTGIFDKFFIKYSNGEFDAVVTTVDFAKYCKSVGAVYTSMEEYDTTGLTVYDEDGISGIDISDTGLLKSLDNKDNDKLIVVFPVEGSHHEACQKFLEFISKN